MQKILVSQIPKLELKILCATFLEAAIRFYEEPEHREAFERWQAEKGGTVNGSENSK